MQKGWISPEFVIKGSKTANTTIMGYASVFDIADSQNDVIAKGAFKSIKGNINNIKLLWQHDVEKPIGVVTFAQEDEYGLKIEAEINNNIVAGAEATELIKQRAICGLSVGFFIKAFDYNKENIRIITDLELIEISVVTFPANAKAEISQIKQAMPDSSKLSKTCFISQLESLMDKLEKVTI